MSKEVMGVSLKKLEDPIRTALITYQGVAHSGLIFDSDSACKLKLTPDKPNSARSETDVTFQREKIGKLFVIAFKLGDGTGSEINYQLENLQISPSYPRKIGIVPRKKTGIHNEGHLTIVRYRTENPHAEPELYAGTFDLLGLSGNTVRKIGQLGHPSDKKTATILTTLTVGYGKEGERFGDPHSVYSSISDAVQVCAFLAISEEINKIYPNILNSLKPQLPTKP